MLRYLHALSAVLFYILGASFFTAYILVHNGIAQNAALAWLNIGDMPLLLTGMLYGGISVYSSIRNDQSHSRGLMLAIGVPLLVLFIVLAGLNFTR
jgi:hypothetical protein